MEDFSRIWQILAFCRIMVCGLAGILGSWDSWDSAGGARNPGIWQIWLGGGIWLGAGWETSWEGTFGELGDRFRAPRERFWPCEGLKVPVFTEMCLFWVFHLAGNREKRGVSYPQNSGLKGRICPAPRP